MIPTYLSPFQTCWRLVDRFPVWLVDQLVQQADLDPIAAKLLRDMFSRYEELVPTDERVAEVAMRIETELPPLFGVEAGRTLMTAALRICQSEIANRIASVQASALADITLPEDFGIQETQDVE